MRIAFLFARFFLLALCHAETLTMPAGIPLSTATVHVVANFDRTRGFFSYSYAVSNSSQSVGSFDTFYVDISTLPGGVTLSSDGLINSATGYSANTAASVVSQIGNGTVPVGFQSQPTGWDSGPAVQLTAVWFGPLAPGTPIAPGQSLGEFVLTSHGTPGIRRFVAEPTYDPSDFLPGIDDVGPEDGLRVAELDKQIQQAIQSQGYTIGPDDPASLEPGPLLDRLISLKHQSVSLDWLRGEEFVKDLDEKLDQAKKALAESKPFEARHKLLEFIHKLEEQRKEQLKRQREASEEGREEREAHSDDDKKFINDNAFYLLKPNAEFIIAKLPAKPEDDDTDSKDRDH